MEDTNPNFKTVKRHRDIKPQDELIVKRGRSSHECLGLDAEKTTQYCVNSNTLVACSTASVKDEGRSPISTKTSSSCRFSSSGSSSYETRDPINEALNNDEILKTIFKWSSSSDLLEFSLVSRLWQLNARYILRTYKKCSAIVKSYNSTLCEDFKSFSMCIDNSWAVPFCGLSLQPTKEHSVGDKCPVDAIMYEKESIDITSLYSSVFAKINIKYLKIKDSKLFTGRVDCPVVKFVSSILSNERVNQNLLALSITKLPNEVMEFSDSGLSTIFGTNFNISKNMWPNLKSMKITRSRFPDDEQKIDPSIIDDRILLAAPRMETFTSYASAEHLEFIFKRDKIGIVQNFAFYPSELTEEKLSLVSKFSKTRSKVKKLVVFSMSPFSQRIVGDMMMRVCKISVQLLESNISSLTKLEIGHLDLIQLIRLRLLSTSLKLNRLTYLTIKYDPFVDIRDHLGEYFTLSRIDYAKYFPYINHLQLDGVRFQHQDCVIMQGFWEDPNYNFISNSVTKLSFCNIELDFIGFYMGRISLMFPNVNSIYVDNINLERELYHEKFCTHLWIAWPLLKDLTFSFIGFNTNAPRRAGLLSVNLDPWFTGIPRNLILDLETTKNNLDDFVKVHNTTMNPSIMALRHLKNLRFEIKHWGKCEQNLDPDSCSKVFLSKLTCTALFERMPNLTVEIARNLCGHHNCVFSLDHLKPYVKFVNRSFDLVHE